jgi:peptidoglycan/LPS O-acetylase OafA/YrhL
MRVTLEVPRPNLYADSGRTMAQPPQKIGEIRALIGARALPPLLLVLYHFHEGHGYQHFRPFDVFVAKGYLWVEFFFALSGFVLVLVYGARAFAYGEFLKARLARLYPLQLATILIMAAMIGFFGWLAAMGGTVPMYHQQYYHPYATWPSFIANLFLVQAWHLFPALSWNGVSWFVSVEFFLCLIFPVYLWLSRGRWWRAGAMIAAGFAALKFMADHSGHGLDITYDFGIVRGMADFAVGVGLAMLYRELKPRADALSEHALSAAQIAVAILFLYAIYDTGWSHNPRDFWIVPPMLAMVLALAFDRGILARALQTRPLMRMGEWSFAVYMGQSVWLQLLHYNGPLPALSPAWAVRLHWILPIVLVIVCTAWGALLYWAVEKPANRALRELFLRGNRRA